ncbi:MAG: hypothetical protein U0790_24215 [Isosphaeraceae bacterium]
MSRRAWLVAVVWLALPDPVFAQLGGMGGMGGGFGGMASPNGVERSVVIETIGGEKVTGKMLLGAVPVMTELGQYQIDPRQVKSIRHEKGAPPDRSNLRRTVVTESGHEITGTLGLNSWTVELEFGSLLLDASKVNTMNFNVQKNGQGAAAAPGESGADRRKLTLIEGPNVAALMIEGPDIKRLVASSGMDGDWVSCELKVPFSGRAMPIVANDVAAYVVGPHVYAFSGPKKKWDVLELPAGVRGFPMVKAGSVRVQAGEQFHEFSASSGAWKHVDLGPSSIPAREYRRTR